MSTVIVTGTPSSSLESVWTILREAGVKQALPSRSHGLLPAQISQKLMGVLGASISEGGIRSEDDQIAPPELWQSLFLDLAISNAEKSCWGWADTQSLHLADYWQKITPDTRFVLVFSDPGLELANSHPETLTAEAVSAAGRRWLAYNSALLHVYAKHKDRCILVSSQQALLSPEHFIEVLDRHWGINLRSEVAGNPAVAQLAEKGDLTLAFLSSLVCEQDNEVRELYAEIQALAIFPFDDHKQDYRLQALNNYRNAVKDQTLLLLQLRQVREEVEYYYLENMALKNGDIPHYAAPGVMESISRPRTAVERVKRQLSYRLGATLLANSGSAWGVLIMPAALLKQIMQYRREQKLMAGVKLPPLKAYPDAEDAEQVKSHLSYRLGAKLIEHSTSPIGWITLPAALKKESAAFHKDKKSTASD